MINQKFCAWQGISTASADLTLRACLPYVFQPNNVKFISWVGRRVHINGRHWDTFPALLVTRLKCAPNCSLVLGFIFFSEALDIVFHYKELKNIAIIIYKSFRKMHFLSSNYGNRELKMSQEQNCFSQCRKHTQDIYSVTGYQGNTPRMYTMKMLISKLEIFK